MKHAVLVLTILLGLGQTDMGLTTLASYNFPDVTTWPMPDWTPFFAPDGFSWSAADDILVGAGFGYVGTWNGVMPNADQWIQVKYKGGPFDPTGLHFIIFALRMAEDRTSCSVSLDILGPGPMPLDVLLSDGTPLPINPSPGMFFWRISDGSDVGISGFGTIAPGDVVRFQVVQGNMSFFQNDMLVASHPTGIQRVDQAFFQAGINTIHVEPGTDPVVDTAMHFGDLAVGNFDYADELRTTQVIRQIAYLPAQNVLMSFGSTFGGS